MATPGNSERVRVLRIIARLNVGGPALHTTLLTQRLDPRRYDARLVAGTEEPGEGNYPRLHGAALPRLTTFDFVVLLPARTRGCVGADAARGGCCRGALHGVRTHAETTRSDARRVAGAAAGWGGAQSG